MAPVETLYSFNVPVPAAGETMFEFLCGGRVCSWYRHDRDGRDRYQSVGRCSASELAGELDRFDPELAVTELCGAADALDRRQRELLTGCSRDPDVWSEADHRRGMRAMQLRRARLGLLDEVVRLCGRRASQLAVRDPDGAALLTAVRESTRSMIRQEYPERRGVPARLENRLHA